MGALRLLSTLGIVHLEPAGDGTFLRRRLVLVHLCALLPRWRKRGVAHGHNSASLHEVLRKPTCGGHTGQVLGYDYIDLENQDEYPWAFCLVFMEGVHDELTSRYWLQTVVGEHPGAPPAQGCDQGTSRRSRRGLGCHSNRQVPGHHGYGQ